MMAESGTAVGFVAARVKAGAAVDVDAAVIAAPAMELVLVAAPADEAALISRAAMA